MRKLICLILIVSLFFCIGCTYDMGKDKSEAVNKGETTGEIKTDSFSENITTTEESLGDVVSNQSGRPSHTSEPVNDAAEEEIRELKAFDRDGRITVLTADNKQSYPSIVLYYQDADGNITPVSRKVAKQDGIARAAVNGLIDNAINREEIEHYGVYPVLPMGTAIAGINVVDGIATIDFNSKILDYKTEAAEKNIISSIVYTMTQFKTIKGVRLWINGKPQKKLKFNSDISGILSRKNVLINSNKLNLSSGMEKSDIYVIKYLNEKQSYAIPISVEYSEITDDMLLHKIVELLTMDYGSKKLYSALPKNTKLIGYDMKDGLLTLNFNKEIANYGGNAREDALIKQIFYSAMQIEGVERLRILIEGKETVLPEGTELTGEIKLPVIINTVIEE